MRSSQFQDPLAQLILSPSAAQVNDSAVVEPLVYSTGTGAAELRVGSLTCVSMNDYGKLQTASLQLQNSGECVLELELRRRVYEPVRGTTGSEINRNVESRATDSQSTKPTNKPAPLTRSPSINGQQQPTGSTVRGAATTGVV